MALMTLIPFSFKWAHGHWENPKPSSQLILGQESLELGIYSVLIMSVFESDAHPILTWI
jgi:hypothetical protein